MSPQIPTFTGKRELTTEPGAVPVSAEAYGIKGDQGKILQTVGETLSKVGAKFQEIQDVNEYTQAQINSTKRLNDVWTRAQADPDIWNAGKTAQEEINKISDESVSKISNQLIRNRFLADFEMDKLSTTNKITDHLRKKQLDDTGAKAMDYISTFEENYYSAGNDVDRQIIKNGIKNKINDLVIAGVWDKTKAQEYWAKEQAELNTGLVRTDMSVNPEGVLIELKKGKEGLYPDITHDERLKLMDAAETQMLKDEKVAERNILIAKNKNESDSLDMYRQVIQTKDEFIQKKLTADLIDKVNKDRDAGLSDANFAVGLVKALTSPRTVNGKQDNATYEEIMTDIAKRDLTPTEIRTKILKAYADGKLTQSNLDHFLYIEKGDGETTVFEDYLAEQGKAAKSKSDFWGTAWNLVKTSAIGPGNSYIMDNIIKRVQATSATGPKIVDIAKEEIDKNVKLTNPNKTKYEKGQIVINAKGESGEIIGFTNQGIPLIRIKRGKPVTEPITAK